MRNFDGIAFQESINFEHGSLHFQNFARDINDAVSNGKTGDELIDVAVESRNNSFNGTAWEKGNKKVVEIIKNKSDL